MKVVLLILGAILIVLSLILMLAQPIIGVLGIIFGVVLIIASRKKKKKEEPEAEIISGNKINAYLVSGYDDYQEELKELLTEPNDEYTLSKKFFLEEVDGRAYEFLPEWVGARLVDEGMETNAVYVDDVKIGYVPKKDQDEINGLDIKSIEAEIYGGRYKDISVDEWGEEKIVTGESPYKAKIYIESR